MCSAMSIFIGLGSYRLYPDPNRLALAATFLCTSFFAIVFAQWFRPRRLDLKEDEFVFFAVAFSAAVCCGSMWMAETNSPLVASLESAVFRF